MSPKHVDMSMLCRALSVVSRATRANTMQRGTRKEAGITRIESGVLNIRSVITRCRSVSQHRTSGVIADNLITLTNSSRWSLPGCLNVNAWSLSIEKLDELLVVARMNDVVCVNVTET